MPINPFKAGRAVGKGVRYLTQLGSKIGKSLGSSVDKLGAGTRNTQAATIKGVRGVRDAAQSAGRGIASGAREARRGYNVGRSGGLTLDDVANKSPMKGVSPANYDSWAKKNPGIKAAADKMRGNKDIYGKPTGGSTNKMPGGGAVWDDPSINPDFKNRMTKYKPKGKWIKTDNRMTKSKPSGDKMMSKPDNYMNKKSVGFKMPEFPAPKFSNVPSGMSKNRRAGIITGASIAAGYGVHKGNDALQNHYRSQKNAARGGM